MPAGCLKKEEEKKEMQKQQQKTWNHGSGNLDAAPPLVPYSL